MTVKKDYLIQVKVKNAPLMRAIRAAGYETVGAFCNAHGLCQTGVGRFVGLKNPPIMKNGQWSKLALNMSAMLKMLPDQLFPEQHLTKCLTANTAEQEVSCDDINLMTECVQPSYELGVENSRSADKALSLILSRLTQRERLVIQERQYRSLFDIAGELGVTRERVRQIEAKAYRKMRHFVKEKELTSSDCGLCK